MKLEKFRSLEDAQKQNSHDRNDHASPSIGCEQFGANVVGEGRRQWRLNVGWGSVEFQVKLQSVRL